MQGSCKSQELHSIFRLLCVATEIKAAVNLAIMFFDLFFFPINEWLMQHNSLEIPVHIVKHIWSSLFHTLIRHIRLNHPCKGWSLVCYHMLPPCQKCQACQSLWMLLQLCLDLPCNICHFLCQKKCAAICLVLQNVSYVLIWN